MSTRTTYTAAVEVPVYASWKCENCGEINFATGTFAWECRETTSSTRSSKLKETKAHASNRVREEWAKQAYRIIGDPNHSGHLLSNYLFLQNTNCTKCGKKPRWNKKDWFLSMLGLAMGAAFISGIIAIALMKNVAAWLIFGASVGFIVWGIKKGNKHEKMIEKLPKEYTPVIGSLNSELIEYADKLGKSIPTPEECVGMAMGFTLDKIRKTGEAECRYCRKCGTQIMSDSSFCHKCGGKIVI